MITVPAGRRYAIPVLYTFTAFFGAGLIFMVQPLVSKLLLPSYGGSAAVWTTSSFFFQVLLLLGYILVHSTIKLGRRQAILVLALAIVAVSTLPLALPGSVAPEGHNPFFWLVRTLGVLVGLPYLMLSTTGPLIQKWYSWTGALRSEDPYFIYAASNTGSFLGLLAYPFLMEPTMTLASQRGLWTGAFIGYVLLLTACALVLKKQAKTTPIPTAEALPLTLRSQVWWVFLAFIPSSLMLGATTFITTDVAAIPLLWVIPLALYLATMTYAFARRSRTYSQWWFAALLILIPLTLFLTSQRVISGIWLPVGLILLTLTVVALVCHMSLAGSRPPVAHLTRYYVLVSLGGALGGAFNSLLAPLLFPAVWEFAIVLALALLVMASWRRVRYMAVALMVLMLAGYFVNDATSQTDVVARERTFYGSYTIAQNPFYTSFIHGTTAHGLQNRSKPGEPLAYYHRSGPLGDVYAVKDYSSVTAIGMGAGTVAAYGTPGQELFFVEIDPEVVTLAEKYFTFLRDSKARVTIAAEDGRLAAEKLPAHSQELMVLDAFSSDSIPMHLLTEEAMKIYGSKLTADGLLAVHISNRTFDLVPVLVAHAKTLGMTPLYQVTKPADETDESFPTTWMVLAPEGAAKDGLMGKGWKDLSHVKGVRWTDDYSSILDVLL